jgi:hypothetical protein
MRAWLANIGSGGTMLPVLQNVLRNLNDLG